MTSDLTVPASHADLLERPLFTHLATVRPDGSAQSSVMWFSWDGQRIRMTHTNQRQKFRNLQHEPRVALSIADPENGYRYLEVRGVVESLEADDEKASFYRFLQERYGLVFEITDAPNRIIVTIRPTLFVAVSGGTVQQPD
jgi:PPOX class probable F420-dependent enzyme